MSIQNKTLLQFNNISLSFGEKLILDNISGSIIHGDKIGLIGINGSGKSSLLKYLASLGNANSGTLNKSCSVEYVPQLDFEQYRKDIQLFKYLEKLFEEWWLVLLKYEEYFKSNLDGDRILSSLSGGELVKLNITIAFAKAPELILLDEPTNHLDLKSLNELQEILQKTNIPFVLVSHNISFLNAVVKCIWELETGKLNVFGGNYNFYKEQKKLEKESLQRLYEAKQKELSRIEKAKELEIKRMQRTVKLGKKLKRTHDRGTDRFAMGFLKNASEMSNANKKAALLAKQNSIVKEMALYKQTNRKNIYLSLNSEPKSGSVLSIENGCLKLPSGEILITGIDLRIYHGDRIAILGDNGSGKTTLVKQFAFEKHDLLEGGVKYGLEYKSLFVDQKYDLINPELSIVENLLSNNKTISYENVRKVLGILGFSRNFDIDKKAMLLSGGETARLAFAIATNSNIDLLILDEPTNNLDIETIEVIGESLKNFSGTFVVISHDMKFLKDIEVNKVYMIEDKKLVQSFSV